MKEKLNIILGGDFMNMTDTVVLRMNNVEINNIKELRENFVLDEAINCVRDKTLIRWFEQLYYEDEAEAAQNLYHNACAVFSDKDKRELCCIVGVDYKETLSEEDKEVFSAHTEEIKKFTDDNDVLKNSAIVALNQQELAKLLNNGETTIYLCHNEFSVPLKRGNVHYIGVDNPVIINAYTAEQYKKVGITMENINLPTEVSNIAEERINSLAKENGYDFYYEQHSDFENLIHKKLMCSAMYDPYNLYADTNDNYYKSKYECEKAGEACIRKAYDEAHEMFGTTRPDSILNKAVDYYSYQIEYCFNQLMPELENYCCQNNLQESFNKLKQIVDASRETLESEFNKEISRNSDYYHLYNFSYFKEKISIEKIDYGVDGDGLSLIWGILTGEGIEYCFEGALDAIIEMNDDLNRLILSFENKAHEIYQTHIEKIETCIHSIADFLPQMFENESMNEYFERINS